MSSQFHENMMALLQKWYPDRDEDSRRSTLMGIYSLENYDYTEEPYPVPKTNIMKHLVNYRTLPIGEDA